MVDIVNYVRLNAVSNIYICLPIRAEDRVLKLMDELKDTTASIYFVPDIFVFDLMQAQLAEIDGIPLVAVCETPFCGMNGVLKRPATSSSRRWRSLLLAPVMLAIARGDPPDVAGTGDLFASVATACMARRSPSTSSAP